MANFVGGSAPAMAAQIVEGFTLMTAASIRGFSRADLGLLRQELEKMLREVRSQVHAQDDALAQQARNRKISRLSSAVQLLQHQLTAR